MSAGAHLAIVAVFWTIVVVALVLVALIRRRRRRAAAAADRLSAAQEYVARSTHSREGN
jgi:hypothetical protein